MTENEIAAIIVDEALYIHKTLGPGLFESVYEKVMAYRLEKRGLRIECQRGIPVIFEDIRLDLGFRADIIVEGKFIIEIKSIGILAPVHHKQLLTYLRLTGMKLGLLINFNEELVKDGIHRIVNNL
jgi:GxxExxY protein